MRLPFKKLFNRLKDKNFQDALRNIFRDTLTSSALIGFLMTPAQHFKSSPTFIWLPILTISLLSSLLVLTWVIYTLQPLFDELLQQDTKCTRACFSIYIALVNMGISFSISKLFT